LQFLNERLDADPFGSICCKRLQYSDAGDALTLLRVRSKIVCDNTA